MWEGNSPSHAQLHQWLSASLDEALALHCAVQCGPVRCVSGWWPPYRRRSVHWNTRKDQTSSSSLPDLTLLDINSMSRVFAFLTFKDMALYGTTRAGAGEFLAMLTRASSDYRVWLRLEQIFRECVLVHLKSPWEDQHSFPYGELLYPTVRAQGPRWLHQSKPP